MAITVYSPHRAGEIGAHRFHYGFTSFFIVMRKNLLVWVSTMSAKVLGWCGWFSLLAHMWKL